jgi:circadian clock protein KaiB
MTKKRLKNGPEPEEFYNLLFYVSGQKSGSNKALKGLRELCEAHLAGRYKIEIIDLAEQPERAHQDRILATPTLVKLSPPPGKRLFGDLSDQQKVLEWLEPAKAGQRSQE